MKKVIFYLKSLVPRKSRFPHIIDSEVSKPKLIHPEALIEKCQLGGEIKVGPGSWIHQSVLKGVITIGRHVTFNGPDSDIYSIEEFPVSIGNFCSIARGVKIQSYNHNYHNFTTYFFKTRLYNGQTKEEITGKGPITIGSDVWIGTGSVILSGTTIGHGAVIAANSVVSGNVAPYSIIGGNPAKLIKYRFSQEKIDFLLSTEWWDWDNDKIYNNYAFLNQGK